MGRIAHHFISSTQRSCDRACRRKTGDLEARKGQRANSADFHFAGRESGRAQNSISRGRDRSHRHKRFGKCPGVTLEDLEFSEFKKSCISFVDCVCAEKRPVLVQRIRCQSQQAQCEAAIDLTVSPVSGRTLPNKNESIQISNCRFEGSFKSAIRIDGTPQIWKVSTIASGNARTAFSSRSPNRNTPIKSRSRVIPFTRSRRASTSRVPPAFSNPPWRTAQRVAVIQNYFFNTTEGILVADDNPAALPFVQNQSSEMFAVQPVLMSRPSVVCRQQAILLCRLTPRMKRRFCVTTRIARSSRRQTGNLWDFLRSNSEAVPSTKSLMRL